MDALTGSGDGAMAYLRALFCQQVHAEGREFLHHGCGDSRLIRRRPVTLSETIDQICSDFGHMNTALPGIRIAMNAKIALAVKALE